ncbi:MAG: hypothetical protein IJ766_04245 [Clostridia bacterium]|nr:hypothetical protein [Clostridia bacterium]
MLVTGSVLGHHQFFWSPLLITESISAELPAGGTYALNGEVYYIDMRSSDAYLCRLDDSAATPLPSETADAAHIIIGAYHDALVVFTGSRLYFADNALQITNSVDVDWTLDSPHFYADAPAKRLAQRADGLYVLFSDNTGIRIYPTVGDLREMPFREDSYRLNFHDAYTVNADAAAADAACITVQHADDTPAVYYLHGVDDFGYACAPLCMERKDSTVTALLSRVQRPAVGRTPTKGEDIILQLDLASGDDHVLFISGKKQVVLCVDTDRYLLYDDTQKRYMTYDFAGNLHYQSEKVSYIHRYGMYTFKRCGDRILIFDRDQSFVDAIPASGVFDS